MGFRVTSINLMVRRVNFAQCCVVLAQKDALNKISCVFIFREFNICDNLKQWAV